MVSENHSAAEASTRTADPTAQTPPTTTGAPRQRSWWKTRAVGVAAVVLVAGIGSVGYFGVKQFLPHHSAPAAPRDLPEVAGLPPGAVACDVVYDDVKAPFNAGARGTPMTSCAFVEQVRRQYSKQNSTSPGPVVMNVVSPVSTKWYNVACIAVPNYVTCTGGAAAVIYLYNK